MTNPGNGTPPASLVCDTTSRLNNSPYAERPEGSRKSSLFSEESFGTVCNINLNCLDDKILDQAI